MKTAFKIIFFLSLVNTAFAQQYVQGTVLDKATGEPIPFTNVVLKGTYKGSATNFDGEFILNIPKDKTNDTLVFSVVGYKTLMEPVKNFIGEKLHKFYLTPFVYEIADVTVESKSQLYNTILKRAAENISKNYYQGPFNYDMYYRNTQMQNNKVSRERQAAVRLYDAKGYGQANAFTAYKERGYEFLQVRRSFELNSLSDRSTQLDDLLEFDIVRIDNNVLNPLYVYDDYDAELLKITQVDGDSVWVIKFKCTNPTLGNTGDNYALSYKGLVYIKMKDYAVIKYEAEYESSNYSTQGRSLYVNEAKQENEPMSISYKVTTRYKEYNGTYFLSSIEYKREQKWRNKKSHAVHSESVDAQILVTDVVVENPEVIAMRAYYEEVPFDAKFWETFNYLKDEKPKNPKHKK